MQSISVVNRGVAMRTINAKVIAVILLFGAVMPAMAGQQAEQTKVTDILPELVIRPMGVLGTAFGTGLFLFTSPVIALATIPEPHDALQQTFNDFVVSPYRYTFRRPLGTYHIEIEPEKPMPSPH